MMGNVLIWLLLSTSIIVLLAVIILGIDLLVRKRLRMFEGQILAFMSLYNLLLIWFEI